MDAGDMESRGSSRLRAMSTTMAIEVAPAPPPVVILPEDVNNQANAVPPEGDPKPPKDDDAASNVSSSLVPFQFRKFTQESYQTLLEREAEEKRKAAEKKDKPSEGRLVDGELVYDVEDPNEPSIPRDPTLVEGNQLPEHLEQDFPKELLNQPVEEIDDLLKDKTFVVITKRFKKTYIHRFSATSAFFLLAPWNPVRRAAIYITTSQVFDYCIILTILTNCIFMAWPETTVTENAEFVFLAIYTFEAIVRLLSRGFILSTYTYLRDGWNWLDFLVIVFAYLTIALSTSPGIGDNFDLNVLRVFRVFRAMKAVSIVPGLKTIIAALFSSMRMMAEVMFLLVFCMMVFALFTLQVYIGILRQKCVKDIPPNVVLTDYEYQLYLRNESNWLDVSDEELRMCGNASYAGSCPTNYTCLPDIGDNPNSGYTNFDNFGWAMLTSCQLITLDFWEDTYNKVIRTNGPSNVLFFLLVVFFGSFYLINLMLAVVSMSYEEEALNAGKLEKEKERRREKRERRERKERERRERAAASAAAANPAGIDATDAGPTTSEKLGDEVYGNAADGKPTTDSNNQTPGNGNTNASNSTKNTGNKVGPIPSKTNMDTSTSFTIEKAGEKTLKGDGMLIPIIAEDAQSVLSMENQGDIPDVTMKEDDEAELVDRNCQCCARCCLGYPRWLTVQNFLYTIVTDIVFELFISFCIGLNVVGMAVEHYPMDPDLDYALKILNIVFTVIFTIEAVLKIIAHGKYYFVVPWNIFDIIIVIVSYVDIAAGDSQGFGFVKVIRILRLMRVFKLAQTWSTMRVLISIMGRTVGALGNLSVILAIIIYTFAVLGMKLFGKFYTEDKFPPGEFPRWHFIDFWHSCMLVFRILCGEWVEPLWDCMKAAGEVCMVVFIPTLVIGNFVVFNLFLALLLNSFATDSLDKTSDDENSGKMKQGWLKLKGLFRGKGNAVEPQDKRKPSIADIVEELKRQQQAVSDGDMEITENRSSRSSIAGFEDSNTIIELGHLEDKMHDNADKSAENKSSNGIIKFNRNDEISEAFRTDREKFSEFPVGKSNKFTGEHNENSASHGKELELERDSVGEEKKKEKKKKTNDDSDEEEENAGPGDCFPDICCSHKSCGWYHTMDQTKFGNGWRTLREYCNIVTESKAFEYFIVLIILTSSFTLCFEDIYLYRKPELKEILKYLNIVFGVIFVIEMLLKWISIGLKNYFSSFWYILDFCIVVVTVIDLLGDYLGVNDISGFKVLRTLRALRPLRAISRWEGMRIVVNALAHAIPAFLNVVLVCLVLWLIFAIAGFQLFAGKFFKCVDKANDYEMVDPSIVPNREVCLEMRDNGTMPDLRWVNAVFTFDNVYLGLLSLLQIATFEGWMELMDSAIDITDLHQQPVRENSFANYIFFVIFIFLGSFFSLNLFIGVIIENFNMLKKKYEGGYLDVFLTPSQKNYYNTMKKLGNRKPQKTIKRPKNDIQAFFFDVAVSTKFELAIVVMILLNMFAMAGEHYQQSQALTDALDIINIIFTTIFTLEAVVKIIGLRWHYFRRMWNVFDLIIVIVSIIGVVLADLLRNIFITPTLLRVVRVFRIGRVLRLIKAAKGIRKLLFALVISMPALLNIGTLLAIIMFMFAIFFMNSFGNVKHNGALNDLTNFETFANSLFLLFRLTTAAGWNDILEPLMNTADCSNSTRIMPDTLEVIEVSGGDCGSPTLAGIVMSLYIIVTYLIIINMYIAVILENFNQAHEQEEVGITEDDFEMFYVVWERYDPHATQFIKVEVLSDLVADLDLPLGIPKPNEIALVAFDLPIMEGERLHCLDVLTALVKYVLGGVEDTEDFRNIKVQMEERHGEAFPTRVTQVTISTTMRRKKEDVAAKTLQRAWRKHKAQQNMRKITNLAMEAKLNKSLTRTSFSAASGNSPHTDRPSSSTSSNNSLKASFNTTKRLGNTLTVPSASDRVVPPYDGHIKV